VGEAFKQTKFTHDRISDTDTRDKVNAMPEGADRTNLLKQLKEAEAAVRMQGWVNHRIAAAEIIGRECLGCATARRELQPIGFSGSNFKLRSG
jgi:hypothetical protein